MEGSSLLYVTTLPGLLAIGIVVVGIKCFQFITLTHVATCSQGCVTKQVEVSHSKPPFRQVLWPQPCDSSDTSTKRVYMILQNYVIKGTGDFMEENSSLQIPTLPKLIAINIALMDYICHVVLQGHVIIQSCNFMGRSHPR